MKPNHLQGGDISDAEMDVQNEEKEHSVESNNNESDENSVDDEEEIITQPGNNDREQKAEPFLDSFYGLASTNPEERSRASHVMLHHSLLGPDANSQDAAYALKRLMNGLCSGRAASRQGMASALATYLKLVFRLEKIRGIRDENETDEEKSLSDLAFIRRRLIFATENRDVSGRKQGAEDRDYQFGRLFGINAVVRSMIILPRDDVESNVDDIIQVSCDYANDLIELYNTKKWMREPAAHAIVTLLTSFFSICQNNTIAHIAHKVLENVVELIIIPKLLLQVENTENTLFSEYSAEQAAIAIHIQANLNCFKKKLPHPINNPILCKDTISSLALALSETSTVTQPRTHLVWDTILAYVTEKDVELSSSKVEIRRTRKSNNIGTDTVEDVIEGLISQVIIEKLLGAEQQSIGEKSHGKPTHERTALALCIVRNLSGVEYVSSISGRTKIIIESQTIQTAILRPTIIKRMFLDVLSAGTSGRKQQAAHILKPLAQQVLESIVLTATISNNFAEEFGNRRLALACCLVQSDPRFDVRTKTSSVASLLGLDGESMKDASTLQLIERFVSFAEQQILSFDLDDDTNSSPAIMPNDAMGYIELLYQIGKELLKLETSESDVLLMKITSFLMILAFFDCKSVTIDSMGKKKKKRKDSFEQSLVMQSAGMIQAARTNKRTSIVPYDVRSMASSRFFSLIASNVGRTSHSSRDSKDSTIFQFVSGLNDKCHELEKLGATRIAILNKTESMEDNDENHEDTIKKMVKKARELISVEADDEERPTRQLVVSFALLASTLYLHLLNCGQPDLGPENDDPDVDEDEDAEDLLTLISDVHHVYNLLSTRDASAKSPLYAHTEVCVNILSSHVCKGNQSRGASPTLLKDMVKGAWIAGLSSVASNFPESTIDSSIVILLLNSIGASDDDTKMKEEGSENEDMEDDSSSDSDDKDASDGPQTPKSQDDTEKRNKKRGANDIETDENDDDDDGDDDDDDVEIDANGLQSLLEEDSDAEVNEGELEHHAGADGALARLIQMKQEARKAGQLAIERIEIGRQLRCIILLEAMVVGKSDSWGSLLSVDTIVQMIVPILQYRREVSRSLDKANEKGSSNGQGERWSLMDRLSSLVKTKLLKVKVPNHQWSSSIDVFEFCTDYSTRLLSEAKIPSDKEHQLLCNQSLMYMIRNMSNTDIQIKVANIYGISLSEWSMKRSKLESSFFETLIQHYPVMAQVCLAPALAKATNDARSTFLKSECYRYFSLLCNGKLNPNETEIEKIGIQHMIESIETILDGIVSALQDDEMKKTKRIREVLKCLEKIVTNETLLNVINKKRRNKIKLSLEDVRNQTESENVKMMAVKIEKLMESKTSSSSTSPMNSPQKKESSSSSKKEKMIVDNEDDAAADDDNNNQLLDNDAAATKEEIALDAMKKSKKKSKKSKKKR